MTWICFLPLSTSHRPPTRAPRRGRTPPAVEGAIASWVRRALLVPADATIEIAEWVATDSRATPHTVHVLVGTGRARRCFVLDKASERITEADVRAAVR
jgi:hypothetical protein